MGRGILHVTPLLEHPLYGTSNQSFSYKRPSRSLSEKKKKKVDQQEVSMTSELCSVHEMPEAHQSQRRGLKVSPGVGSGELGFR